MSIDPERDTTTWLREYARFMPKGFIPVTGTAAAIRATADAWDIRYAREETGTADYSMSHTADVFLVDGAGKRRATFPFGTSSEAMTAVLRSIEATPGASTAPAAPTPPLPSPPAPPAASTSAPSAPLGVEVVSSSVWSGAAGPVILQPLGRWRPRRRPDPPTPRPACRNHGRPGRIAGRGGPYPAAGRRTGLVRRVGRDPGARSVAARRLTGSRAGSVALDALDPGTTPSIGGPAPAVRTPTLADVGGIARAVTTDPAPDLRLSTTSTADALADHRRSCSSSIPRGSASRLPAAGPS